MIDKQDRSKALFRLLLAGTALATMSACSGGGGGSSGGGNGSRDVSNAGEGDPDFFRTGEFLNSAALQQINADEGYARIPGVVGGDGVTVAIIDDGIDADHVDLADNLVADLISSGQIEIENGTSANSLGPDGHGTAVAGIIAGARNDVGIHGVAFDAGIVSFDAFTEDGDSSNGSETVRNIATGLRIAGGDGRGEADIINMSLRVFQEGDGPLSQTILDIADAMEEAADNGKIIVVSAGNQGEAEPSLPAAFVDTGDIAGLGIAVGSVDADNNISGFSNRCGATAAFCMVAPGEAVAAPLIDDAFGLVNGTSFAAPLVAGSAAVIKAAFPGIGSRDVVDRLLTTAEDLGEAGTDPVFGRGLLDLEAALAPVGELSLSVADTVDGASVPASSSEISLDSSFALGGAAASLLERTILLDEQNFPFLVDLNRHVEHRSRTTGIESFVGADRSLTSVTRTDKGSVSLSFVEQPIDADPHRQEFAESETSLQEQPDDPRIAFRSEATPGLDLFMSLNGTAASDLGIGRALAADDAVFFEQRTFLAPYERLAGLQSGGGAAFEIDEDTRIGLSSFTSADDEAPTSITMQKIELTHRTIGDIELRLGYGLIQEQGGVIGSSASGAFGLGAEADTQFADISLIAPITDDVSLFGAYSRGRSTTSTDDGSLLDEFSETVSEAFGVGMVVENLFQDDDGLTLMVGQPLRVSAGAVDVTVPVARTEEGGVLTETVRADLSPEAREIATEAVYRLSLGGEGHDLTTGAFARFNPDHDPDASPDLGFGIKYRLRF